MSRRLVQKSLPAMMAAWIMLISVFATSGLVICIGENGHLALEATHHDDCHTPSDNCRDSISHAHFGDCSDTSISLFYGRVRTGPVPEQSDDLAFQAAARDLHAENVDIELSPETIIYQSLPLGKSLLALSNVILIC